MQTVACSKYRAGISVGPKTAASLKLVMEALLGQWGPLVGSQSCGDSGKAVGDTFLSWGPKFLVGACVECLCFS